jgi:hypothetical protein
MNIPDIYHVEYENEKELVFVGSYLTEKGSKISYARQTKRLDKELVNGCVMLYKNDTLVKEYAINDRSYRDNEKE